MHLDVTARRQIEESLGASGALFRQVTESIRDVFFLIDSDSNRTLYISSAYEEIWGRSCENAYASPDSWMEAIHPDDRAGVQKAKARGDRYLFYTQKMTETVASKLALENQLRQALDKGEFVLHYQPQVSLANAKLTGAEALIRWNDPRTGLVPPGQFIPVLEETGLIYEVGRWALHKAIEDSAPASLRSATCPGCRCTR